MKIDLPEIVLIEDTREQAGYGNLFSTPYIREGLPVGDYSIAGLTDRIAIERKSLVDLVGSLTHDRARFEKEIQKARSLDYFAVVIEAAASDILEGRFQNHSQANPTAIFESVMSWSVKYGRPFLFCESRSIAARTVESLLLKYCRRFVQTAEEIRKAARRLQRSA